MGTEKWKRQTQLLRPTRGPKNAGPVVIHPSLFLGKFINWGFCVKPPNFKILPTYSIFLLNQRTEQYICHQIKYDPSNVQTQPGQKEPLKSFMSSSDLVRLFLGVFAYLNNLYLHLSFSPVWSQQPDLGYYSTLNPTLSIASGPS